MKLSDLLTEEEHSQNGIDDLEVVIQELQFRSALKNWEEALCHITLNERLPFRPINVTCPVKYDFNKLNFGFPQIISSSLELRVHSSLPLPSLFEVKVVDYLSIERKILKVQDLKLSKEFKCLLPNKTLCKLGLTSKDRKALQERWLARKKS